MRAFDAGRVAIVLVSGYHMVPRGKPHWIFAFGRDGRHVLMHDPAAVRDDQGMAVAAETYAVPWTAFERVTRLGPRAAERGDRHPERTFMTGWVILVDQPKDLPNADTPHKVITTSEYLARPRLFDMGRPKLVNLARPMPTSRRATTPRCWRRRAGTAWCRPSRPCWSCARPSSTSTRCRSSRTSSTAVRAGPTSSPRARSSSWSASASPAIRASNRSDGSCSTGSAARRWRSSSSPVTGSRSSASARATSPARQRRGAFLREALHQHTKREWRDPKARTVPKYDLAVLYDPNEKMAPSSPASIKYFARIAERLSVDVEPITRRQLAELAEYDGLFIRETTSIDNHTYRFARRAWQEGMPVIDDPISMIRCTNKVFLMELLGSEPGADAAHRHARRSRRPAEGDGRARAAAGGEDPRRLVLARRAQGHTPEEFRRIADELFEETDLLLAQKFLPTEFDWRVGVLAGEPLFVCQYRMARGHWQIVKHRPDGSSREGGFRTFELDQAPPELIDIAVRAARPIGEGFYGVDVKETDTGFIVMEVNDNPNLEHGIEDQVGKDEIWIRVLKWFIERFEQ